MTKRAPTLKRTTFKTSRLLEFCSTKELTNLVGHGPDEWPLVVLKELVDNGLDAAEEAGVAPCIEIAVSTADRSIAVTDNGPGFPARTIASILDFSARTSSKEAYCSPTRGQQGHALSTVLAMPFALAQGDEAPGQVIVEANSVRHEIALHYDPIRRVPIPKHERSASFVKTGTRFAVQWPVSGTSKLVDAKARFLQIADAYIWLNPHLELTLSWDGAKEIAIKAYKADWEKWLPSNPPSAHWYDYARFERRIAAQIAHDQDRKKDTLIREFLVEFRGLSGTAKQKAVLDRVGGARVPLSSLYGDRGFHKSKIAKLLSAMHAETKQVQPKQLGVIGGASLVWRFFGAGAEVGGHSFQYKVIPAENDGRPCLVETAFAPSRSITRRRLVVGVNWSPAISGNPFKAIGKGGDSLDSLLASLRVQHHDKAILFFHVACPTVQYIDRGKAAMVVGGEGQFADEEDTFDDGEAS
jgi:DNA topoisomerase VI subunit B